ncbi:MAG: cytochrome c biogenesis protein CcsA [Deltaproteobacteria bacterium]|nr:cytochrome c biogenesis protein CcsA [Deltaproteobacteria bacterium]
MSDIETILLSITLAIGIILSGLLFFCKDATRKFYLSIASAILLVEGAYIGIRWFDTGHPPMFGTFEATLTASWILILLSVFIDRKERFAGFIIPFALLTLLYGLKFDRSGKPLIISEQSYWVYFHALFAWIAYGFYTFSFAGAALSIIQKKPASDSQREALDEFIYRMLLNGFLAQTIMFVLGSYYSIRLHGSWWVWDPVEYLFVVSWCLYALPIHGRILYGWGAKRVAWLTVLAMAGTMLLYWGLIYFPFATYHIFDTDIKSHYPS